jgi:tetratricopeptide (TPR) repeat protein
VDVIPRSRSRRAAWNAAVVIAALGAAAQATAQAPPRLVPPRPRLEPGADTNSAAVYYAKGVEWLGKHPRRAADAFHWASLLNPDDGAAFYARWAAGLLSTPHLLPGYVERVPSVLRSPEYRRNDSLLNHASTLDPFHDRDFEELLLTGYWIELARSRYPGVAAASLRYEFAQIQRTTASPYHKAMIACASRDYPRALDQLGLALRTSKSKFYLHSTRATVYHHMGLYDSAAADMIAELAYRRQRDTTEEVVFYESKAALELGLGRLLEIQEDLAGAYEAYLRSAAEDLGFAPAHIHLAILALQRGDTATAVSEVNIAVDAQSDDPALLVKGSLLLISAGQVREAVPHLLRARDLNPYYATPHYLLARLHDVSVMPRDAVEHYHAFLAHASRVDARVAMVRERLATLQAPAADSGATGARVSR